MNNVILDGQAFLNDHEVPFHFEDNNLKLYFEHLILKEDSDEISVAEEDNNTSVIKNPNPFICVRKRGMLGGGYYLMHLERPFTSIECVPFPHTCSRTVNWYIDNFDNQTKYHEVRFRFDELSYFIPGYAKVSVVDNTLVFDRSVNELLSFIMKVRSTNTTVKLVIYSNGICLPSSSSAQTVSEVRISFDPTDDYEFLHLLYLIVEDTFSFICNRKNLKLDSAILVGTYEFEGVHPTTSILHVYDKYKEPVEEEKVISRTANYEHFENCFGGLMQIIASNYDEAGGTISMGGIHPSTSKRSLIDLRQSINITSAFEHHVRRFMPEISSSDTLQVYDDIKKLITDRYISMVTGKRKKVAKDIVKNLKPTISLGDKISKAVQGYTGWDSLESVVNERFPDWDALAGIANSWRNELAHEKREFIPTYDTIRAVRLVEHLNYAIVLRAVGYSNERIKQIVNEVLIT